MVLARAACLVASYVFFVHAGRTISTLPFLIFQVRSVTFWFPWVFTDHTWILK